MASLSENGEQISATKQNKMLSYIGDVITIIDKNGIVTYKSPNLEKLFGWKPKELIGKNTFSNVHKNDVEASQVFFESVLKEPNASGSIEMRYKCKDGSYKWIQFTGTNLLHDKDIRGILGNYHDISDRKKAQISIEENETRFKALFHNLTNSSSLYEVLIDIDGKPIDYRFIAVNQAYEKNIGLKENQLAGKTLLEVFPTTEKVWLDTLKNVFLTGTPIQVENYSQEIDKYFELIVYKFHKSQIAMIGSDITDRKLNELELIKAKEKAEESDHLKSAFLQNMSHEIRTPLNAICGFSNFLGNPELTEEKRNYFISIINNSSSQLLSIVNDILAISTLESKQEKINIETFNLNEMLSELNSIYKQQSINQNISLVVKKDLPEEQSLISSDKTKLTQVLSNLINNALKFTCEGLVEFGYTIKDEFIEFFVKDSGPGIKTEFHQKIFERFRQADISLNRNYGGSGLGLSISKGYIELLKGQIWVESKVGNGATFFFTVPYQKIKSEKQKQNEVVTFRGNDHTILIAEDEEINFLYIKELLEDKNIQIIHAKDGNEAVDICKTNSDIRLVLMDIKMPNLDGYTAAKLIKKYNPKLPIIAQTAYALSTDVKKFSDVFDEYITKPIKSEIIFDIFVKYLNTN